MHDLAIVVSVVSAARCLSEEAALSFVEHGLGADEAAAVREHIDACGACRELVSEVARAFLGAEGGESDGELRVGRYVVRTVLGAGAMGIVYAGHDPELDRPVALKVLLGGEGDEADAAATRLQREAQAMARLSHPNVVTVYDVGAAAGRVFIAMELVEGRTLGAWLREKEHAWREILDVFVAAGHGLAAAHASNVVHRDFKPDNVLVGRDGRVRVTDFGLARSRAQRRPARGAKTAATILDVELTRSGVFAGTPAYMAPEQFDVGSVDARSDQFAFAASLFEALYGVRPFDGATFAELADNVRTGRVRKDLPDRRIPARLRSAILRGLEPDPARRWPAMRDLLAELERARASGRPRTWRRFASVLALALAAALLVVGWAMRPNPGRTRLTEAMALQKSGDTKGARAAAAEADAMFQRRGDRAGRLDALFLERSIAVAEGDFDAALPLSDRILAVARETGEERPVVKALAEKGEVLLRHGRLRAGLEPLEQALTGARRLGDPAYTVPILQTIAQARTNLAQFADAAPYYAEAKTLLAAQGKRDLVAELTTAESVAMLEQLDLLAAERTFTEGLATARRLGDARGEGFALLGLGSVLEYRGDLAAARARFEEWLTMALSTEMGSMAKVSLAILAMEDGRPADAEKLARASAAHFDAAHTPAMRAYAESILAWSLVEQRRLEEARVVAEAARHGIAGNEIQRVRHTVLMIVALVDVITGNADERTAGLRAFDDLEAEEQATGTWRAVVWTHFTRARAALETGDPRAPEMVSGVEREARDRGLVVVANLAAAASRRPR
jgi:tRNA A-37 threonylcarbamoyl transferase component Bud32